VKQILPLAVVLAAVPFVADGYVVNILIFIALNALPALGLSLLMGYTGQISLGHAAFYGLGAYGSALLSMRLGLNPWATVALTSFLVAFIAWGLGWLVFRLRGHHLAMATLAFGLIVHVGFVELHEFTGGPNGLPGVPTLSLLGTELFSDFHIFPVAWIACLAAILLSKNLVGSPLGLSMRAVAKNEKVAASLGQDVQRLKRYILVLSAVMASVSGGIYAHYIGYLSPNPFGVGFSIQLLVMVAIGGFSNIWGVLFGVAFVTVLGELLKPFGFFDVVIFGTLLVTVMVFCPKGLLDGLYRVFLALKAKTARAAS
jgi:branched-chain amino acid transport system permease protein